jgi:hypothetical protein
MLIVAGALGLWLVLVVLVLAALRAAALADLEESRRTGRRPGHGRPQAAAALVAVALSPGVPAQADAANRRPDAMTAEPAPDGSSPRST